MELEAYRMKSGALRQFSDVGGYTLLYLTKSNVLCAKCADKKDAAIECVDIYWNGNDIECDGGCGKMIEPSYGE